MAVLGRVAVARKMFGGHQNGAEFFRMSAQHIGTHELGNLGRILAVGTDIDDGVVGVVVYIGHRREDPVDAERPGIPGGCGGFREDTVQILSSSERHVRGPGRGGIDAHGRAAFEIGTHQEGKLGYLLHAVQQSGHGVGLRVLDTAIHGMASDDEAAHVKIPHEMFILLRNGGTAMSRLAVDRHDQELGDLVAQGHGTQPGADGEVRGAGLLTNALGACGGVHEPSAQGQGAADAEKKAHSSSTVAGSSVHRFFSSSVRRHVGSSAPSGRGEARNRRTEELKNRRTSAVNAALLFRFLGVERLEAFWRVVGASGAGDLRNGRDG